jgi:hypothetical protein
VRFPDEAWVSCLQLRVFFSIRWLYRAWYYFRVGYGTYLTFLLGYFSTLVTVYYLAIQNMPALLNLFPRFVPFAVIATLIGGPLSVAVGWIHLKRSGLFSSEALVQIESNPYNYKLAPGYWKDAFGPAMVAQLRLLQKLSESAGVLTPAERAELMDIETKWMTLVKGGYVGAPRRGVEST